MRRSLHAVILSAAILSAGLLPRADACAPVMKEGQRVAIASESALIVWDEKTKTEHFIRRANFDTSAPYFGFLVPTPSMPTLSEVPDSTFQMLENWTKPEVKTEVKYRYRSLFGGVSRVEFAAGAAEKKDAMRKGPRPDVEVLDRVKVAGLDATILKATDAEKLRMWLLKHGYEARPALTEWLEWYVRNGWIITAFQFKKENAAAGGLSSSAVRMSFKAERPFYPYREPADARMDQGIGRGRFLRVFFVGTGRYSGRLEGAGETWPGEAAHARPLANAQMEPLTKGINSDKPDADLASPKAELPENPWLTVFDDPAYPRPGTGEVYFSTSPTQDELVRPPIINYTYVDAVHPGEIVGIWVFAGVILLGGAWIVWRFGMRAAE